MVDGLVFRNIRVSDGNGAGIRTEMGNLTVRNSMFLDSQEGILGGQPTGQKIAIDRSTFAGLGTCDDATDCAHSIYLANQGSVTITRSRFERGRGGHYVKLRVPNLSITDNSFDDSAGRKTNYMIDLPRRRHRADRAQHLRRRAEQGELDRLHRRRGGRRGPIRRRG